MADLIDRMQALDAVNNAVAEYIPTLHGRYIAIPYKVGHAIMTLPSVEPKKGKWILRDYGERIVHICSECGVHVPEPHADDYKFCPNCGVKMKKIDE